MVSSGVMTASVQPSGTAESPSASAAYTEGSCASDDKRLP